MTKTSRSLATLFAAATVALLWVPILTPTVPDATLAVLVEPT